MAWTTADRDAVKAAIASGTTSVRYGDREVQYATVDDLLKALAVIEAELANADTTNPRPRTWYGAQSGKGW